MNGLRIALTKDAEQAFNGNRPRKGWVVGFMRSFPFYPKVLLDGNKHPTPLHPKWFCVDRKRSAQ